MKDKLTYNEKLVINCLKQSVGKWISPTSIEWMITGRENHSSWASHICLRLVDKGLLKRSKSGQYLYEGANKTTATETKLKCSNGDLYTISTLANGLQIKKNSNNDEKISISTCKGDRIIIGDNTVYIY